MGCCIIYGCHGNILSAQEGRSLTGNHSFSAGVSHQEYSCRQTLPILSFFFGTNNFIEVMFFFIILILNLFVKGDDAKMSIYLADVGPSLFHFY